MTSPDQLLKRYPIVSDQMQRNELEVILRLLQQVLNAKIPGDVVELGCFEGTTALFLQRVVKEEALGRKLYLYDSFAGLPDKAKEDSSPIGEQFRAGELYASKQTLLHNFRQAGLPLPFIKKAWFKDLTAQDLPDQIAFAFLDGDFYDSILDSLRLVWPKLAKGAIVVIDDYANAALPGVQKAVSEWQKTHSFQLQSEASLAVIRP